MGSEQRWGRNSFKLYKGYGCNSIAKDNGKAYPLSHPYQQSQSCSYRSNKGCPLKRAPLTPPKHFFRQEASRAGPIKGQP